MSALRTTIQLTCRGAVIVGAVVLARLAPTSALRFLGVDVAAILAADFLCLLRVIPVPTITEDVRALAGPYPAWTRLGFLAVCVVLYFHFFEPGP